MDESGKIYRLEFLVRQGSGALLFGGSAWRFFGGRGFGDRFGDGLHVLTDRCARRFVELEVDAKNLLFDEAELMLLPERQEGIAGGRYGFTFALACAQPCFIDAERLADQADILLNNGIAVLFNPTNARLSQADFFSKFCLVKSKLFPNGLNSLVDVHVFTSVSSKITVTTKKVKNYIDI